MPELSMRLSVYTIGFVAFLMLITWSPASACTICHSKNPKMVNMHKALGFKDCFKCHGPGKKTSSENQSTQMITDPLCVDCHKK